MKWSIRGTEQGPYGFLSDRSRTVNRRTHARPFGGRPRLVHGTGGRFICGRWFIRMLPSICLPPHLHLHLRLRLHFREHRRPYFHHQLRLHIISHHEISSIIVFWANGCCSVPILRQELMLHPSSAAIVTSTVTSQRLGGSCKVHQSFAG